MMTPKSKICRKCGVEKLLDEFDKNKAGKFGRRSQCKVCMAEYREANREKARGYARRYREENPEKIAEQKRRYYEENREQIAEQKRRYYEENRDQIVEQKRQYNEANRGKRQEWVRQNPEKNAANTAKRRAAKLNRTPAWADLETIKLFYETRQAISEATGRLFHVDHEIPLQGKTVSGLHVPSNLQIIPAEHNIAKGNRF